MAQKVVLDNLRTQLRVNRRALIAEVASYGDAGLSTPDAGPDEAALLKRLHRLASVDDKERIETWRAWFAASQPPTVEDLPLRQQRLAAMLFFIFWRTGGDFESIQAGLEHLWRHPAVLAETFELLGVVAEQIEHVPLALPAVPFADVPLSVHARYGIDELLAGLGRATLDRPPSTDREGVRYVEALQADVFTFTLQKAERDYSPTTMYRDYAISPDLVHWESQSTTSEESKTGQRYLNHRQLGTHVLLFARETEKDDIGTRSFLFLGPARYVSDQGSRPIAITWRLDHPMPADFFARAQVLAG